MKRQRLIGVAVSKARRLLLALPGVEVGRSYGLPAFKIAGQFLARFRDQDTVLVLKLGGMTERDVLMQLDPNAFFTTDHYRDHPTVLIRLACVPPALLNGVIHEAHAQAAATAGRAQTAPRARAGAARHRTRRPPSSA